MRTYEEYEEILSLWDLGFNKKQIARLTGVPRETVRDCINRYVSREGLKLQQDRATKATPDAVLTPILDRDNILVQQAYAYLLGLYLGDGVISKTARVHRIRIALDKKYPNIITACVKAVETILPNNKVAIVDSIGCVYVSCYHKFWPEIFPQDGDGRKHEREIRLETWQQEIVDRYPLEFFRGLFHSDGSRFSNIVNGKDYPRYQFSNYSADIRSMFCDTCDNLGLHWTLKQRKSIGYPTDVFISKRKDVEYLDSVIGPKC